MWANEKIIQFLAEEKENQADLENFETDKNSRRASKQLVIERIFSQEMYQIIIIVQSS